MWLQDKQPISRGYPGEIQNAFNNYTREYPGYKFPIAFFVKSAKFLVKNVELESDKFSIYKSDIDIMMHMIHAHGAVMSRPKAEGLPMMTFLDLYDAFHQEWAKLSK